MATAIWYKVGISMAIWSTFWAFFGLFTMGNPMLQALAKFAFILGLGTVAVAAILVVWSSK
jgi:hypothetical protein